MHKSAPPPPKKDVARDAKISKFENDLSPTGCNAHAQTGHAYRALAYRMRVHGIYGSSCTCA